MYAFVTGSTGFVGGQLVSNLVEEGDDVRALARRKSDTSRLKQLGVEIVEGDVIDPSSFADRMKGCDVVYHVANIYEFWLRKRALFYEVNVEGTRNVLKAALNAGVPRVVYTSTSEALGERKGEVATEETQHTGFFPSDYNRSKHEGEMEAMKMCKEHGLPLVVVNPAGVLGPGDLKSSGQIIIEFLNRKLPGRVCEDSYMSFVDVRDVAKGHILAAKKGRVGERYILSAETVKWKDFYNTLSEISAVPAPKRKISGSMFIFMASMMELTSYFTGKPPGASLGGARVMIHGLKLDASKSKRELGMEYRSIKDSLHDAIAWYREHGYAPPSLRPG
jgi:dihydroflavonol-4-reductase